MASAGLWGVRTLALDHEPCRQLITEGRTAAWGPPLIPGPPPWLAAVPSGRPPARATRRARECGVELKNGNVGAAGQVLKM